MAAGRRIALGEVKLGAREMELLSKVVESSRLSYGPMTRELERKLAELHDVEHAVFMASGTCALQVGFEALKEMRGWPDGAEVIIPATTFIATMGAVIDADLKPVLCDVDPFEFCLDHRPLRYTHCTETIAILPVYLLGRASPIDSIMRIVKELHIDVVEDCCEAVGVSFYTSKMVGSFGAFSAISTYVCHHLSTGVGGAVLTNDSELETICRSLIQHGRDPAYLSIDDDSPETVNAKYRFVRWGHSFRSTEQQAALGLAQIDKLEGNRQSRLRIVEALDDRLKDFPIFLPTFRDGDSPLFYPIVVPGGCAELIKHMENSGIETRPLMPLLNQKPVKGYLGKTDADLAKEFPVAWRLLDEGCIIGCHPGMTDEDIDHIGRSIDEYFSRDT